MHPCTAQCLELSSLANGYIQNGVDITPDFDEGTTATHACNTGFALIGNRVRECLASREWSGQTPECQCKLNSVSRLHTWCLYKRNIFFHSCMQLSYAVQCVYVISSCFLSYIQRYVQHWHPFQTGLSYMLLIWWLTLMWEYWLHIAVLLVSVWWDLTLECAYSQWHGLTSLLCANVSDIIIGSILACEFEHACRLCKQSNCLPCASRSLFMQL